MLWLIPSGLKSSRLDVNKNLDYIGQLLTPRTWHMNQLEQYSFKWAGDNDCYTGNFNKDKFINWLKLAKPYQDRCLFITCPDVVCDPITTNRQYLEWRQIIKSIGYHPALVLQDGIKSKDINWDNTEVIFIGGSTDWKLSQNVIELLIEAGERHKWRHVGRINSLKRMRHFWNYAESFDGTDYVYHPEECIKIYLPMIRQRKLQGIFQLVD